MRLFSVRAGAGGSRRYAEIGLAIVVVALFILVACTVGPRVVDAPSLLSPPTPAPQVGVLDSPIPVPELSLQRGDGRPFLTSDLRGRVSLVFFGYTRCPDVCPLTLLEVGKVRQQLGSSAADVDAYFVTVDPTRDSAARLREYTANFGPGITGVTGSTSELARAYTAFGVVAQRRDVPDRPDDYFMDHTAFMYLIDREARIRVAFPYGTPIEVMADAAHRLVNEPIAAVTSSVMVDRAWARPTARGGVAGVYLVARNGAAYDDRLLGVRSDLARTAEMHRSTVENGMMRMMRVDAIPVPPRGAAWLEPGGFHIMLVDVNRELRSGDSFELVLQFERAGDVRIPVIVQVDQPSA